MYHVLNQEPIRHNTHIVALYLIKSSMFLYKTFSLRICLLNLWGFYTDIHSSMKICCLHVCMNSHIVISWTSFRDIINLMLKDKILDKP